jgi:hypothetical protein
MYQFLQRCLELLRKEFSELKTVTADQLMYVKEDLILPHHYTFYDFIVTKVRSHCSEYHDVGLWVVTPSNLVDRYCRFKRYCCIHS